MFLIPVNQSPRRNLRAVRTHGRSDGSRTNRNIRMKRAAECLGQGDHIRRAGRVRGTDSELLHSLCPVMLIPDLRHNDLRHSGHRSDRRGTCATMMHDRSDAPEERLQVVFPDGQAIGFVIRG
jgi:hypothetical protein